MNWLDSVHESWLPAFEEQAELISKIGRSLTASTVTFQPAIQDVFRAFEFPMSQVRVLIVGQDPYPTAGLATGVAFSVPEQTTRLPQSLRNIFTEMVDDLGVQIPSCGDLSPWQEAGVLLLNRTLTVQIGNPGSHRQLGWQEFTQNIIQNVVARGTPLVSVLWGRDAQLAKPLLGSTPFVESAHPSPLSAHRGFFGSRPFSRVNEFLIAQGSEPIDWRLP